LPCDWSELAVRRSRANLIGAQKSHLSERLLECEMLFRAELRFAKRVARQLRAIQCSSVVVGIENAIYVRLSNGLRTRDSETRSENYPAEHLTHSLSSLLFLCQLAWQGANPIQRLSPPLLIQVQSPATRVVDREIERPGCGVEIPVGPGNLWHAAKNERHGIMHISAINGRLTGDIS
jgi:hypothetical protein